jgi:hypothetical protein
MLTEGEGSGTVDLHIKAACFVKKILFAISKVADMNELVQGDQLY